MSTQLDNKISLLDKSMRIVNENQIIKKIKENKKNEKYRPSYIEKIVEALKEKLQNKNFSDLNLEEWLEPEGICFNFAKKAEIKRTQLRKYFDEIKQIKVSMKGVEEKKDIPPKIKVKLTALIPKFAYAKGRKLIGEDVYDFFSFSLKKVKDGKAEDFKAFEQILEAILAYHTYHKPKE